MTLESKTAWRLYLKPTLRLAWPIVVGNLGQMLIGVVDTLMIGRLGVVELGAAAFVNNLLIVPLVTTMGLLAAVTVLLPQAKGAGDERQAGRHIKHGLVVALVVAALATVSLGANAWFLDGYGQDPAVVEVSRSYYWLIILSLFPALVYHCLKCVSEGLGWSNPPMLTLLAGIVLNVFLNWVLIFGKLGAPEMGLIGAGVATLIARTLIALVMLVWMLRAPRFRSFLPRTWVGNYNWQGIRAVLKMGVPMALQSLFEVGAFAGAGIMVGWIGAEQLAAHQIAMSCAAMAFMIPLGFSIACGIRVGEAHGAGNLALIRGIFGYGLGLTVVQTLLSAAVFLSLGSWLASLFIESPTVIEMAAGILVVVGLFQIFDGAQVTCIGALRGMSDVNMPMLATFVAYWLLALPAGYLLGIVWGFGATGVWAGLAIGLMSAASWLFWRVKRLTSASRRVRTA